MVLTLGKKLVPVLALGLLVLLVVLVISEMTGTPVPRLVRDPTAVLRGEPQIGFLSTIGVSLWSATVAVCLFASWGTRGESRRFLLWSGLFSLLLALDDAFQLHEYVVPRFLEGYIVFVYQGMFIVYFLLFAAYLIRFFQHILRTDYVYLGAAMIAFAASIVVDLLYNKISEMLLQFMARSTARNMEFMLEDGFKFLGIVLWLSYFVVTAAASLGYRK